jgi:hypothetical protein
VDLSTESTEPVSNIFNMSSLLANSVHLSFLEQPFFAQEIDAVIIELHALVNYSKSPN